MKRGKVLISGGLGFIGLQVAKLLVQQKQDVLLFDNLSSQIHGPLPSLSSLQLLKDPHIEVVRGDVCKGEDWETALSGVSSLIHLAAATGTAQSMYEIARYTETNVGGTANLFNYLANRKHDVSKVILASSRSVYGEGAYSCECCGPVYPPARSKEMLSEGKWDPSCPGCGGSLTAMATGEDARTSPASIYAATKLAQEDIVRIGGQALGIPAVIFRFQNVYGEGQSLKNPYTGILSIFSNQMRLGKAIDLYEDGLESRDFVHVSDVARAVVMGITSDRADGYTLNVGSGQPTSVQAIALLLKECIGCDAQPVVSGHYRVGDIRHGYADLAAIGERLGFEPEVSLEAGIERFVEWVMTQAVEPDRLGLAAQELSDRGLMRRGATHGVSPSSAWSK